MTESAGLPAESDPRSLAPVRPGEIVAGKYVVGRLLGLGGMGAVFEASDSGLERRVALKVLLPRLASSPIAAQRFVREARAATRITSEHVVKLLEIESLPDGTPVLVMEYLEGKDLRALLREGGPLEPRQAVDYLLQALQAVAEGHVRAIVHRDLKPSNLFLSERADGTPLIKVLDFGIAKTIESGRSDDFALTSSEDVQLGSPTYMPPEQFRNPRSVDARADIWALGVTLYELISGRVPFQGLSYPELVSQVLSGKPDSLKSTLAGVSLPEGLAEVVGKCLEKDRELRYLNAVELAIALAPFGSDDARLSLTRVSGLSRQRTPSPALPSWSSEAYEATLPVAVDPDFTRPHTNTSSGARKLPMSAPRKLPWLALFVAGAVIISGWMSWRQRHTDDPKPRTASRALPRTLSSSLSSLQAAPVPLVRPSEDAAPAATTALRDRSDVPSPTASDKKQRPPIAHAPKAAKRLTSASASTSASTIANAPATVPTSASADALPRDGDSVPHQLIESLIEERH
jgi:eukaryotic-like serine/threonine-protein kinase